MREAIEELMKRVRKLAEAFAGGESRKEREEEETAEAETRRRGIRRETGRSGRSRRETQGVEPGRRALEEGWEEAMPRRADRGETMRRGRGSAAREPGPERPGYRETAQARQEGTREWNLPGEAEEADRAGRGGDAREYGFGDGTDPSRYFYSEDYLERLSGYLETDARRYGPRNMD